MNIIRSDYRENLGLILRWLVVFWGLSILNMIVIYILDSDSIQDFFIRNLLDSDSKILKIFLPFGTNSLLERYMNFNNILLLMFICLIFLSINVGLKSLAKEQGLGSIDYLYLGFINRTDLYFYKIIASMISIISFVLIAYLSSSLVYSLIFITSMEEMIYESIHKLILIFFTSSCLASITTMISAFLNNLSKRGVIVFALNILIIGAYLIYVLEIESNFFIRSMPLNNLINFVIDGEFIVYICQLLVYIILILVSSFVGISHYNKKDLII